MPIKTRNYNTLDEALSGIGPSEYSLGLVRAVVLDGMVTPGDGLGGLFRVTDTLPIGGVQTWETIDGGIYLQRTSAVTGAAQAAVSGLIDNALGGGFWHADDTATGDVTTWAPRLGANSFTTPQNPPDSQDIVGRRWIQFDAGNTEILTAGVAAVAPDRWTLCMHMIPEFETTGVALYGALNDDTSAADYSSIRNAGTNDTHLGMQVRLTPGHRVGGTDQDPNHEYVVLATYSLTDDTMRLFVNGIDVALTLTTNTTLGAGPFDYNVISVGGRSISSGQSSYADMKLRRVAYMYDVDTTLDTAKLFTEAWHGS